MAVAPFEDGLYGALFGDPETAAVFSEERAIARWNRVEAALTRACRTSALVPEDAARAIEAALVDFRPDGAALAEATVRDGLPIPAYVRALRERVGEGHAHYVHLGATSQDILDSALALALREVNQSLSARLRDVIAALDSLDRRFGRMPLLARTRMQAALAVTVGARIGAWRAPLVRQRALLDGLRPRIEVVSCGGPVGDRRGWHGKGETVAAAMAEALDLGDYGVWHTARDGLGEYAAWLAGVSASLGKIGGDVALMAQQGIGEIRLSGGGGSSAMAHKHNPVTAEILLALARFNAAQLGAFAQALVHEQERSGVSWSLEWMVLPQMCVTTGAGLRLALRLAESVEVMGTPTA